MSLNSKKLRNKKRNNVKYIFEKKTKLFELLKKIKLWPSRSGLLHGIKSINTYGNYAEVLLYCGQKLTIKNSKNSRAARWLRNQMMIKPCKKCEIPDWKLEKYSKTTFK
jgi:pyrrolysyl-tRNA synthetase-like protein